MGDPVLSQDNKRDDADPVVAEFPIFVKPQLDGDRKIYILQFPNRERSKPYDAANGCTPLELRIKPNSGMVEVDVPLDVHHNYDRAKGIKWGDAMKKSSLAKGGGSHGLPGGFGIGGAPQVGRGRGRGEAEDIDSHDKLLEDFDKAVSDGHVMKKQTLGGQFVAKNSISPTYMVGTFTNGQLHLIPVNQIVPLRPQFHHIDAAAEQERLARARNSEAPRVAPEARAVHMTVKTSVDGEDDHADNMSRRIQEVQAELWRSYTFIDAEQDESWAVFQESFFAGGSMGQDTEDLLSKVPKLISGITDEQYLDMISAPIDKNRLTKAKLAENVRRAERGLRKRKPNAANNLDDDDDSFSSSSDDDDDPLDQPSMAAPTSISV